MAAYPLKLNSELLARALLQDELRELFQATQRAMSGKVKHCCYTNRVVSLRSLHHSANAFLREGVRI